MPVEPLAREFSYVFVRAPPQQQATNVVVEENGTHQLADVPRLSFELALEIGHDEAAFLHAAEQRVQADMVRLLRVLHAPASKVWSGTYMYIRDPPTNVMRSTPAKIALLALQI